MTTTTTGFLGHELAEASERYPLPTFVAQMRDVVKREVVAFRSQIATLREPPPLSRSFTNRGLTRRLPMSG